MGEKNLKGSKDRLFTAPIGLLLRLDPQVRWYLAPTLTSLENGGRPGAQGRVHRTAALASNLLAASNLDGDGIFRSIGAAFCGLVLRSGWPTYLSDGASGACLVGASRGAFRSTTPHRRMGAGMGARSRAALRTVGFESNHFGQLITDLGQKSFKISSRKLGILNESG